LVGKVSFGVKNWAAKGVKFLSSKEDRGGWSDLVQGKRRKVFKVRGATDRKEKENETPVLWKQQIFPDKGAREKTILRPPKNCSLLSDENVGKKFEKKGLHFVVKK